MGVSGETQMFYFLIKYTFHIMSLDSYSFYFVS